MDGLRELTEICTVRIMGPIWTMRYRGVIAVTNVACQGLLVACRSSGSDNRMLPKLSTMMPFIFIRRCQFIKINFSLANLEIILP